MLTSTTRAQPHPSVIGTTLPNGGVVLMQVETRQYYTLNGTGSHVWKLIQNNSTVGEITGSIESRYEVTPDFALRSVIALITDLADASLAIASAD